MNPPTRFKQITILPTLIALSLVSFGFSLIVAAVGVPGTYDLSFENTNGEPVSSLTACNPSVPSTCEELILKAHIEEKISKLPAQGGAVVFQYCSYKGLPPGDITRADEAPTAACNSGLATWKNLRALLKVNESGDAYLDFGLVLIPRTVGFRFKYRSQGSNVMNGMSDPRDFIWTPGP